MADIVICCDGTWNTPDDLEGGVPAPTNVVKLHNALSATDAKGVPIKRYYHPGVGTDGGWWDRIAGGGAGVGLGKNVQSAYGWLARNFSAGDLIWLFGFSRGAFTVRSLSGMISRCGLLDASGLDDKALWAAVGDIFDAYREKKALKATAKRPFHGAARIHFIGVWDTVGALGVPDDMALLNLVDDPAKYQFHDTALSEIVDHARHAVAIDERRRSFTPTLWTDTKKKQDLKQIWFPGVHSDVGGGYGRCGLSDGALEWMMKEASGPELKDRKLAFRDDAWPQIAPDARGVLHDSLSGVFKALKSCPREVPKFADGQALHDSAFDRFRNPPLAQRPYWPSRSIPATVDVFARDHWGETGLYLEKDVRYVFKATGAWVDADEPFDPNGSGDGRLNPRDALHLALRGWGKAEELYKAITGNAQADFWMTLRDENTPWFALMGMIASGSWFDAKGKLEPKPLEAENQDALTLNETFKIGKALTFTPKASGYLYCFANDVWSSYGNNRGSVRLSVST